MLQGMGQEGLLSHPLWKGQGGEALGPLPQDKDPHFSVEQTRTLQSRTPQPIPTTPQRSKLPPPPSPALMGKREPTPGQQPRGDAALREGEAACPRTGAERWLREPHQKFHLEAAHRQGLGGSLCRQREGKGGLVHALSRDRSQFEFLPKDGQQFT